MWLFPLALPAFCALDWTIDKLGFTNPYYLIHSLHNAVIVYLTAPDVYATFTDFYALQAYSVNLDAAALVAALHIYHILMYREKLRFDDWLHHGLMIGVALPIGCLVPCGTLMGFNLFFTTGLPGGIDYFLLFLVRNYIIHRMTEKRINRFLNVWIRSPGCQALAAIGFLYTFSNPGPWWLKAFGALPPFLTYWNGQYFMEQVVSDYALRLHES
jgi:hypothetical protein